MDGDANKTGASGNWQYKPGDADPQPASAPAQSPQAQASAPALEPAPVLAQAPQGQQAAPSVPVLSTHPDVSWTATEFIAQEKSPLWYLSLVVITAALAALVKFVGHDTVSMVLIILIGIIVWVVAGRQPRSLQYLLDSKGVTINRAFRPYGEFKSFAIVQEGQLNSIIFMPLKRFTLPLSFHVNSEDTDQVVAKLSDYLPNDQSHGHDSLDRLVQRLHF